MIDRRHLTWAMALCGLWLSAAAATAADAPEGEVEKAIRKAAPAAAAMDAGDFAKLAGSAQSPGPNSLENQPLTLLFLMIPVREKMTEQELAELDFGPTTPKPTDLVNAFKPDFFALLITPLQPNYIKSVTAKVDGDTATGEIAFAAPKVYKGRLTYVAKKVDGRWKIVEFAFPVRGQKTALDAAGKWKISAAK